MLEKIDKISLVAKEFSRKHKTARIIDMIVMLDDLPNHQPLQDRYNSLLYVTVIKWNEKAEKI